MSQPTSSQVQLLKRLAKVALIAVIRGLAYASGTTAATLLIVWIAHR